MQTAGATLAKDSRLIGEWTGFCSADINDTSEEENKFITYNQFNVLISEALKDYTKNVVLEESQSKQDNLIKKLQSNMIQESTEQETSIHIEDASDLPAVLSVQGNHYQEQQEGTDSLAVLTEGSTTKNAVTVDIKNGNIKVNGTNTTTETLIFNVGTVVLTKGETYYIKRLGTVNGTGIYLNNSGTQVWGQVTETSFVANATGVFNIALTIGTNAINNTTQQFLVSKTSGAEWIEGKAAMPSLYYPSEISTVKDNIKIIQYNKNFFNVNSKNIGGVDLVLQEDGKYKINGNSTTSWSFRQGEEILLKAGDYTLSVETEKGTFNGFFGIRGSNNFKYETKGEVHISLTEDKLITCYFTCSGTATFDDVVVKVQLEKSKVKTEWAKHEEKEYNLSVQQEMLQNDYFDLTNNKEIHNYEKKNMSNLEWQISTNQLQEKTFDFVVMFSNEELLSTEINCFSNCFKSETASYLNSNDEEGIGQSKSQIICRIGKEKVADLNAFKTLLAEKNAVVYVKTRSELDLTEEQKETLAQLNNLELFKGVNNIYTEQDLALLKLDYTADTKTYIDNQIASQNQQLDTIKELLSTTGTSAMLLDNLQNDLESEVM